MRGLEPNFNLKINPLSELTQFLQLLFTLKKLDPAKIYPYFYFLPISFIVDHEIILVQIFNKRFC